MTDRDAVPPALERALLDLVDQGAGRASWHWIATRLPGRGPLDVPLMGALAALRARGYLTDGPAGPGMDAWTLTEAGRARRVALHAADEPEDAEVALLCAALRSDVATTVRALTPYADDGPRMASVLRAVLRADPALAGRVAFGGALLPSRERGAFLRSLLDHPLCDVRRDAIRALRSSVTKVSGLGARPLPDPAWEAFLQRGLEDTSSEVRAAAAELTFCSNSGHALVESLIRETSSPDRGVRWWSILALGAARDAHSRELLVRLVDDADFGAAAVRALAARSDGHARWVDALTDAHDDVRVAATFALAEVVDDLSQEYEQRIEAMTDPSVVAARDARLARRGSRASRS